MTPRVELAAMRKEQSKNHTQSMSKADEVQGVTLRLAEQIERNRSWQATVLHSINSSQPSSGSNPAATDSWAQFLAHDFTTSLLERLPNHEMDSRYEAIRDSHEQTFKWIFRPPAPSQDSSDFSEWLESGADVYWITGKPGSGKSTLMKYIANSHNTRTSLQEWAGSRSLLTLSCYFWISGTPLQKNMEGLILSVLHQAVKKHPELATHVFSDRFRTFSLLGRHHAWLDPWRPGELKHLLLKLVQTARETISVLFLIDGLDEFDGPPREITDLLQTLRGPHTKLLVSSRPRPVFEDAFSQKPSLRVEQLTESDISCYVEDKLGENLGFQAIQELDEQGSRLLKEQIINKAEGVFLWVYLVVRMVAEASTDGELLAGLRQIVDRLPSDLADLFDKILFPPEMDPTKFRKTSELIQLVHAAVSSKEVTLLLLSFAEEEHSIESVLSQPARTLKDKAVKARVELARRRLIVNSGCLIEATPRGPNASFLAGGTVRFIHRTVSDYVRDPSVWTRLLAATEDNNFNAFLRLSLASTLMIKSFPRKVKGVSSVLRYDESREGPPFVGGEELWNMIRSAFIFAYHADRKYTGIQGRLIHATVTATAESPGFLAALQNPHRSGRGRQLTKECPHPTCHALAAPFDAAAIVGLIDFLYVGFHRLPQPCKTFYLQRLYKICEQSKSPFELCWTATATINTLLDYLCLNWKFDCQYRNDPEVLLAYARRDLEPETLRPGSERGSVRRFIRNVLDKRIKFGK
jgi:hypothetical protein